MPAGGGLDGPLREALEQDPGRAEGGGVIFRRAQPSESREVRGLRRTKCRDCAAFRRDHRESEYDGPDGTLHARAAEAYQAAG